MTHSFANTIRGCDERTSADVIGDIESSNQHGVVLTERVPTLARRGRACRYSAVPQESIALENTATSQGYNHLPRSPSSTVRIKNWVRRTTKVATVCWIGILWLITLHLVLRLGALRPQMSQPAFLRESIMMLDMLLCSRRTIHEGMYEHEDHDNHGFKIPFDFYQSWMRRDVSNFRFNDIALFFDNNPKWTYHLFADDNPNASETIDGWVDAHIGAVLNRSKLETKQDELQTQMLGPHFTTVEQHGRIACAYSMLQGGASKVDLWRYLIIYHNGGLYVDFDAVLSDVNMDDIIGRNDTLVTSVRDEVEMDQFFILAAKHHPVIARAVNQTTEAILQMAYLENVANGNSSLFHEMGCKEILSKWKTHAMYPLNADSGAHSLNSDDLHALFDTMPYPRRYCTCHNLDHQIPFRYMDQLHAACLTGPNVWGSAFHWALYDDPQASERPLHGIRIFPSQGLEGRLPSKFVQRQESVWHSNRIEKVKDAGRVTQTWPSMGAHFIDFDNHCWKQFYPSLD